jgi:hypothetical protein
MLKTQVVPPAGRFKSACDGAVIAERLVLETRCDHRLLVAAAVLKPPECEPVTEPPGHRVGVAVHLAAHLAPCFKWQKRMERRVRRGQRDIAVAFWRTRPTIYEALATSRPQWLRRSIRTCFRHITPSAMPGRQTTHVRFSLVCPPSERNRARHFARLDWRGCAFPSKRSRGNARSSHDERLLVAAPVSPASLCRPAPASTDGYGRRRQQSPSPNGAEEVDTAVRAPDLGLLAMQKAEGSSPVSGFRAAPVPSRVCASSLRQRSSPNAR